MNSLTAKPPQLDASLTRVPSGISTVERSAKIPRGQPMVQQHFLDGRCGNLQRMRSHASVLAAGKTPHPPHSHVDEELLIVLDGEATLRYDDGSGAIVDHRAGRSDGVYYPAFHRHTIHNHGDAPVAYLMLKWIAPRSGSKAPLALQRFTVPPIASSELSDRGYAKSEGFAGATHHLKKLQCHVSTLLPDGGYDAHADEHDIALVVLEGEVETLGRTVAAGEFAWYASGEPHGMHNPGPDPARYIVFEFHGESCSGNYAAYRKPRGSRTLIKRRNPGRIVKNIKRILGRHR